MSLFVGKPQGVIISKTKRMPNMEQNSLESIASDAEQSSSSNSQGSEATSQTTLSTPTEQILPPITTVAESSNTQKTRRRGVIIVIVIVLLLGVIFGVCWLLNRHGDVVERDEKPEVNSSHIDDNKDEDSQTAEDDSSSSDDNNDSNTNDSESSAPVMSEISQPPVPEVNYLYAPEIGVKFKLPLEVTDVVFGDSTNFSTNFDGAIYFKSITKNGKIYDVDICGGKDGYLYYPFFLGAVMRWIPDREHEWWEDSPAVYESYEKIFEYDGAEYYTTIYGGNGCETGEDTPEYVEAVETVREIINSIEKI